MGHFEGRLHSQLSNEVESVLHLVHLEQRVTAHHVLHAEKVYDSLSLACSCERVVLHPEVGHNFEADLYPLALLVLVC